jgi:hypothetical protein
MLRRPRFPFGPDVLRRLIAPETSTTLPEPPAVRRSVPWSTNFSAGTASGCEIVSVPVVHGPPKLAVEVLPGAGVGRPVGVVARMVPRPPNWST